MEIQNKLVGEVAIIKVTGSIDALTAPNLSEHINGIISRNIIKLVADFSEVDYTSSAGLRVLLATIKQTRSKGGDIYLVKVQANVKKVLELSGFTSILKIYRDVDSAISSYSEPRL